MDPIQVLPPRHFKRWREIPVSALATFNPVVVTSLDPVVLSDLLRRSPHDRYPIADANGRVTSVLPRREAELVVAGNHKPQLESVHWVFPKSTIGQARKTMLTDGADFLCVGDEATGQIHGVLTLHDLLRGESVLEEDSEA